MERDSTGCEYNVRMSQHTRIRRIAKWAGLVVCVLIVVAWAASLRWYVTRFGTYVRADLCVGSVRAAWRTDSRFSRFRRVRVARWEVSVVSPSRSRYGFRWPTAESQPSLEMSWVSLPLWLPLLVIATPTAILWRRDRRIPPGHCQKCGYDLTGNVSGRCPECRTGVGAACPDKGV